MEFKNIDTAPKSTVEEKPVVVKGKTVIKKMVKPIYILAETSTGNVIKTHWLPQEQRWDLFSKKHPPEWWCPVPKRL